MDNSDTSRKPLHILVCGGGIGGLSAALAFRLEGHEVTVFEWNTAHNEAGAAIFVAPNCNGLLRRMGVFVEEYGGNDVRGLNMYAPDGTVNASTNVQEDNKLWQHPWFTVHRAKLHKAIRDAIARVGGVKMRLGARVSAIDTETPSVTLESGEVVSGDVIVGADGVRSACRKALDQDPKVFDDGFSAFRFLIPTETLEADPLTAPLIMPGYFSISVAEDRRLVFYPCDYNRTMNFTFIHPSSETGDIGKGGWNRSGDKGHLLKVASIFAPKFQRLLELAPENSVKIWSLLDMDVLDTWIKGNMALLGDAAHPFLPHQGQGGAQAIEDAVSFAACFPMGTRREDIPERLSLYESCRKERAHKVQELTRVAGLAPEELKKRGITYNPFEFNNYNFGHDEWDHTRDALRRLLWSKQSHYWRQPLAFGPTLPTQQSPTQRLQHTINIKTSATFLRTLFPTGFSFASERGTFATASLIHSRVFGEANIGTYDEFKIYVHGVKCGEVEGSFLLVSTANSAEVVIGEREENGAPCLYCDIQVSEGPYSKRITLGLRGTEFAVLEFDDLAPGQPTVAHPSDILAYRYVPSVTNAEKPDAQYAFHQPVSVTQVSAELCSTKFEDPRVGKGRVSFTARTAESLRLLHQISQRLAELPIYEILEASTEMVTFSPVGKASKVE